MPATNFSVQDIKVQIHTLSYADGSWGFELRYWLYGPRSATTYFLFRETFPTEQKMMQFARRAARRHFQQNCKTILRRLADLSSN